MLYGSIVRHLFQRRNAVISARAKKKWLMSERERRGPESLTFAHQNKGLDED